MRILIVGGGTGGHLFPAIALAEAFMNRDRENQVEFVVTQRPLDSKILGERGFSFRTLKVEGIKGKGMAGKIQSMVQLPQAFRSSLKIIEEVRPEVILGVGDMSPDQWFWLLGGGISLVPFKNRTRSPE